MTPVTFQNPILLLLMLLLIPLAVVLKHARYRRNVVLSEMGADASLRRSVWTDRLRLAAMTLLMLALARPGYSPRRHSVSKSGRDVIFVLDVSQSMLAEDAYPSRLEAAKNGIRDALDSFQTERVGFVIYAGSANILCPLTYDYDFVRYMIDQATTRAVDFGGTTLLSAVEKCTDSMLSDNRKGMQDLIVLTDGEEHGSTNIRVAELLKERDLGLLVIGLGDATSGSRIPIEDEEGKTVYLKHEDRIVTTRLNEQGLRELASSSNEAIYRPIGTAAFDLADIYSSYVVDKPVAGTAGTDTYLVYREAGFVLIGFALILLLFAERKLVRPRSLGLAMIVLFCTTLTNVHAADPETAQRFAEAMQLQQQGRHTDALEAYDLLESESSGRSWLPAEKASLRFNQGLCQLAEASAKADAEPRTALSLARQAQSCFLAARRMMPTFHRAAMRLDPTSHLIAEYQARIQEQDDRDQALQEQMQQLVERLQELLRKQTALRNEVPHRKPPSSARRRGQTTPVPAAPVREPETASADSKRFSDNQHELQQEGIAIADLMRVLDQAILPPEMDIQDVPVSVLEVPRRLMKEVIAAQELSRNRLTQWGTWPDARDHQQDAMQKIQEILDLLASENSGESDESEWDDEEEDWDMMEPSDTDEAMTSSMQGQGDFASGAAMQPLPVPNYSVEDILQQELGNLQFRQQQRAKGNQQGVEKDW
ncbi:von Willebrand factor type A domain protein [Planctomycetes bacterium CA13]|uniref:von Willebrand factor type A domain protein n=1 Tax=Novipirellula herctigrandis TaxID=2527986 RepID=A0A5C5Z9Q5_9BACT|nr:von Willebrand factor type A domain protein [Planctomycetes bacterium CA13]